MAIKSFQVTFNNTTEVDGIQDGGSFLYLNTDNKGFIRFVPNGDATINPGRPVPWQNSADFNPDGSIFYLFDLSTILSPAQIRGMQLSGWQSHCYHDATHGDYWAFSPPSQLQIAKGGHLDLPIENIEVGTANNHPTTRLSVKYYNVPGITEGGHLNNEQSHFQVSLRTSPGSQPQPDLADATITFFEGGRIMDYLGIHGVEFIQLTEAGESPVANAFDLVMAPKAGHESSLAGPSSTLVLSFVVADGPFGALAKPDDLSRIRITQGAGAESWSITPAIDAPQPYWRITIPAGKPLAGVLHFENVVSDLEWGWSELTLQYKQIPGYRDGQFTLPLYKIGNPRVDEGSVCIFNNELYAQWKGFSLNPVQFEAVCMHDYIYPELFDGSQKFKFGGWPPTYHLDTINPAILSTIVPFSGNTNLVPYAMFQRAPILNINIVNDTQYDLYYSRCILQNGFNLLGHEPQSIGGGGNGTFLFSPSALYKNLELIPGDLDGSIIFYNIAGGASISIDFHIKWDFVWNIKDLRCSSFLSLDGHLNCVMTDFGDPWLPHGDVCRRFRISQQP